MNATTPNDRERIHSRIRFHELTKLIDAPNAHRHITWYEAMCNSALSYMRVASQSHSPKDMEHVVGRVAAVNNFNLFLERFPNLVESKPQAVPAIKPKGGYRNDFSVGAEWMDHRKTFKAKNCTQSKIIVAFLYGLGKDHKKEVTPEVLAEAKAYGLPYGMQAEINPPDVPNFHSVTSDGSPPCFVVVWSRIGVDWRAKAMSQSELSGGAA